MKTNRNPWLFWFSFLGLLCCALIVQSSFLKGTSETYNLIPYLTLPAVVFFFLHYNSFLSVCFLLFMSFLSAAFSTAAVPSLFFVYFLCFLIVSLVKSFFFFKSSLLFFILVFTISLIFPYFVDLIPDFFINDFSFPINLLYLIKAFMTLLLSLLLFPILKKYLKEKTGV